MARIAPAFIASIALAVILAGCGSKPAALPPTQATIDAAFAEIDAGLADDSPPVPVALPPGAVSADTLGDKWPFTVTAGDVKCVRSNHIVFVADGVTYAVNGSAKSSGLYQDIEAIRRPDPTDTRYPMSLQPILDVEVGSCL